MDKRTAAAYFLYTKILHASYSQTDRHKHELYGNLCEICGQSLDPVQFLQYLNAELEKIGLAPFSIEEYNELVHLVIGLSLNQQAENITRN